jgi:hypothetical protein
MQDAQRRREVLAGLGADSGEIEELLRYNANKFDHSSLGSSLTLPLPDEAFVEVWGEYVSEARHGNTLDILTKYLVQLNFPVQEGMSETPDYRAATRQGQSTKAMPSATGLTLVQPQSLQVAIYESPGGRIPLIITHQRQDFVLLVQALTEKNEPEHVPDSMGAATVTGYNNWDRIHRLEKKWQAEHGPDPLGLGWEEEFLKIREQKELYKDRFMILSDGPYSNVSARDMNLDEDEWRRLSLVIRRDHECTHYFTQRVFGSMQNNLIDEIIADYVGIVGATGGYRADWFLRFAGLENYPDYREGGRFQNYRGDPPLSAGAFKVLQTLVKNASEALERFHSDNSEKISATRATTLMILALTALTLEELASEDAIPVIADAYTTVKNSFD